MKLQLLIFLIVAAFAAAMVPRERREQSSGTDLQSLSSPSQRQLNSSSTVESSSVDSSSPASSSSIASEIGSSADGVKDNAAVESVVSESAASSSAASEKASSTGVSSTSVSSSSIKSTSVSASSSSVTKSSIDSDDENTTPRICAHATPCGWSIYKPVYRFVEANVVNNYCICAPGLSCLVTEDDKQVSTYVHRCREPNAKDVDKNADSDAVINNR